MELFDKYGLKKDTQLQPQKYLHFAPKFIETKATLLELMFFKHPHMGIVKINWSHVAHTANIWTDSDLSKHCFGTLKKHLRWFPALLVNFFFFVGHPKQIPIN